MFAIIREARFKKISQSVFFPQKSKSANFFDPYVVWPWELVRSKALIQEHLSDTLNIYFWALEKILEASEVEKSIEKWKNLKSNFEISRWIFEKSFEFFE